VSAGTNDVKKPVLSPKLFRALCLLTALANAGGNLAMFFLYKPVFELLGVGMPADMQSFHFVCGFSFTVGILAFMAWRSPATSVDLLVVAIIGKGIYAALTGYHHYVNHAHWFYKIFGIWDAAFVVIFFLWIIQLTSPDIGALNEGEVKPAGVGAAKKRALLVSWSMTGNGARAMMHVKHGLERKGYTVDEKKVEAVEPLYTFPLTFPRFLKIFLRQVLLLRGAARPLDVANPDQYDLVVVNGQTWFLAPGAPIRDVIASPANKKLFDGRDVATLVVCRGLWRRTQSTMLRALEANGARIVGARAFANPGSEPKRCFSLFYFLGFGKPAKSGTSQFLADIDLERLEKFGEQLATR
jgi:hypothetical protein